MEGVGPMMKIPEQGDKFVLLSPPPRSFFPEGSAYNMYQTSVPDVDVYPLTGMIIETNYSGGKDRVHAIVYPYSGGIGIHALFRIEVFVRPDLFDEIDYLTI
jgi:hypothetical protein